MELYHLLLEKKKIHSYTQEKIEEELGITAAILFPDEEEVKLCAQ